MNSLRHSPPKKHKGADHFEAIDDRDDDDDPDAPIPGTVFNERQARILRNVVIIMGLMLIAGFALLIGIIAYRASQPATPAVPIAPAGVGVPRAAISTPALPPRISRGAILPQTVRRIEGMIPRGSALLNSVINGNHLVLTFQTNDKNLKFVLIDLDRWQIAGEALLKQEK
jgi:hypothetical protein